MRFQVPSARTLTQELEMKKTIIAGLLAAAANFANAGTVLVVVSDLDGDGLLPE
jgi:hypothetical protein